MHAVGGRNHRAKRNGNAIGSNEGETPERKMGWRLKHGPPNTVCSFRAADLCNLFTNPGYSNESGTLDLDSRCQRAFRHSVFSSISIFFRIIGPSLRNMGEF